MRNKIDIEIREARIGNRGYLLTAANGLDDAGDSRALHDYGVQYIACYAGRVSADTNKQNGISILARLR